MKPSSKLLPVCAALAALGGVASQPANALMMTQTATIFDADETLTFNLFNAPQSTLTGVEFMINSRWSTFFRIDYSGPEGDGGDVTGNSSHTAKFASSVAAADMGTIDLGDLGGGCTGFLIDLNNQLNVECHEPHSSNGTIVGDVASLFSIVFDPADYIGAGTFDVALSKTASVKSCNADLSDVLPDCNATTSWSGDVDTGAVVLKYTYTVPEPGLLALLTLGFAGLGVTRRRKH